MCSGPELLHCSGDDLLPTGGFVLFTGTDVLWSGSKLLPITDDVLAKRRAAREPITQARANEPGFFVARSES